MSAATKIAKWVQKKPMILIRFDEAFSESLHNSRQGFEHLTMVKPHSAYRLSSCRRFACWKFRNTTRPSATSAR